MEKYSDDEFLLKMFGFMGKKNFIRFIEIVENCPKDSNCVSTDMVGKCGECYCDYIRKVENELTGE